MMAAGLRLALRIARREALRYKGRSALSIALLGLPLLAVSLGASAYDTTTLSNEENARQHLGENEAYIEFAEPGVPITQHSWDSQWIGYGFDDGTTGRGVTDTEILTKLPVGSWLAPYNVESESGEEIQVETPDGLGDIYAYGYNLGDRTYEAAGIEYLEGSPPGRDEVVLSEAAAEYLEVGVGDEISVDRGVGSDEYEVSGIVEIPWDLGGRFAIGTVFAAPSSGWLVDVPEELSHEDALALNELGLTVWATSMVENPPPTADQGYYDDADAAMMMIYGLIVVVVLMEIILLAGPAFAISARRRTREFALMSATGATPAQIRNTVLAGGFLFGAIAAAVAVVLGVVVVWVGLPLLEQLVGHRSAGLRVMPTLQASVVGVAIVTGLLSALAAALSASRINVVAALMGRVPPRKGSKRWMVIGLVMVGAGIAAGFAGITIWNLPLMSAAIVLLQLGLVACTPALLVLMAKLGRWMPLSPRMALREAGRNRGSSAPAIAAVLGVVAGGMAFSLTVAADNVRNESMSERLLAQDSLTLSLSNNGDWDPETGEVAPVDWEAALAETEPKLEQRLDDLKLTHIPLYQNPADCGLDEEPQTDSEIYCSWNLSRPEEHECSYWAAEPETEAENEAAVEAAREDPHCDESSNDWGFSEGAAGSDDPEVVAAYTKFEGEELDAAVAHLQEGGVLVADPWAITDEGTVVFEKEIWFGDEEEPVYERLELPAIEVDRDLLGASETFLSPSAAEQMQLVPYVWQQLYLVETSTPVDSSLEEAISADLDGEALDGDAWTNFAVTDYRDLETFYMMLVVAGLCALITLGSTAVSTGLIIAEQRQDMTTLGAVGAAPGVRKRFAMWQTLMIALFGAGMGTVAGVIGYALIREALNRPLRSQYPFPTLYSWELPWVNFGIMLLAVPLLAAVGALLFTRAKLPSERRLT